MEGYNWCHERNVVTIFSAPNYCYRCGNQARTRWLILLNNFIARLGGDYGAGRQPSLFILAVWSGPAPWRAARDAQNTRLFPVNNTTPFSYVQLRGCTAAGTSAIIESSIFLVVFRLSRKYYYFALIPYAKNSIFYYFVHPLFYQQEHNLILPQNFQINTFGKKAEHDWLGLSFLLHFQNEGIRDSGSSFSQGENQNQIT